MPEHNDIFEPVVQEEQVQEELAQEQVQEEIQEEQAQEPVKEEPTQNTGEKLVEHYQALADKRYAAQLEAERKLAEYEKRLEESRTPQQEVIKEPDPLPPMPPDFDIIDATTDPGSLSAQWYTRKLKYDVEKDVYDRHWRKGLIEERKAAQEKTLIAQQKAQRLGGLAAVDPTPGKADKVYSWMENQTGENLDKQLVAFYDFVHSKNQRKATQHTENPNIPLPLGAGNTPDKTTPDDLFNKQFERRKSRDI